MSPVNSRRNAEQLSSAAALCVCATMTKRSLILSLVLFIELSVKACHADNMPNPEPFQIILPNGQNSSDIYLVGTFDDHRLADANDYTLVDCDASGDMLCYAEQDAGSGYLVSTGVSINNSPPAGLQPGEDASMERKEELCGQLCLEKQSEPLSECVFLTNTVSSSPSTHFCPTPPVEIFDSNVHMSIGLSTEHAHLGLKQYFSAPGQNPIDCNGSSGNKGMTLQYTDLNGATRCEDYAKSCGDAMTDRMVQCEADGYGTITIHYNTNPTALANTICSSSPLPADTCSYTFRVRCSSDCSSRRRRRERHLQAATVQQVTNLVVLFRFADHASRQLPTRAEYATLMNAPDYSVKDVFLRASSNNLILDSEVIEWVTLDSTYTETYCSGGRSGGVAVFHECLINALGKIDNNVNFDLFDNDGDSLIDSITFFHSGFAAEWGKPDEYGTPYTDRIWSHKWGIYPPWTSGEGIRVGKYHVNPGVWGISGSAIGRIGVVSHETAHFFGLVDRYDTSGAGNGLGSFSLMANSWGVDGSQRYPPNLSACDKMEHGWVNIIDIERLGNYQIDSQCDSNTIYRIGNGKFGLPQGEFFLLEYRQSCNYDILLEPGLAIYHYDAHALDVMTNDKSDPLYGKPQGFPGADGFPQDGKHYRCSLVQADGLYQLERKENRGDPDDLFHPGQRFGPSEDPNSGPFPNSDSYQAGNLAQTGIIIQVGDFFTGTSTSGTGGVVRNRRRKLQSSSIQFAFSATEGSPAAIDGATPPPTNFPTMTLSEGPSARPSLTGSHPPSVTRSEVPTAEASSTPSVSTSDSPSTSASAPPSLTGSHPPSVTRSEVPTAEASSTPSVSTTDLPSTSESAPPSLTGSHPPSVTRSEVPTAEASSTPSVFTSDLPSTSPSNLLSSSPVIAASARPSAGPSKILSASPSEALSSSPSTTASNPPSGAASVHPSTRKSEPPTLVQSSMPSISPSSAPVTVSTKPSSIPTTVLPDPYMSNSSVCKESILIATEPFVLRSLLVNIQTEGIVEVTVDYKAEGDISWTRMCHVESIVGQYPTSTLLPMSSCAALTVLNGEQLTLRLSAQPASSSSGAGGSTLRRLLGREDIPPEYETLESMYNYEEKECLN